MIKWIKKIFSNKHEVDEVDEFDEVDRIISYYNKRLMKEMEERTAIRHCIECGNEHNTGIEDRMEGTFKPVNTCIDCLMRKCSFKPVDFEDR
jgi:hypothetical protein